MTNRLVFSVPAYIGGVAAGACTVATMVGLGLANAMRSDQSPLVALATPLVGVAVGLLPALVVFLPAALFSLWLANRFGLRAPLQLMALGALSSLATVALVWVVLGIATQSDWQAADNFWMLAALSVGGIVAAVVYRWLDMISLRKRVVD